MLRIGLTGDLGSGKSTVAAMLAARGAIVLSSDDMARAMMQPGEPVYTQILAHFGPTILATGGTLDRRKLASLAFDPTAPRVDELNAIIHPAVLAAQAATITSLAPTDSIIVIESALVFSAYGTTPAQRRDRFDRILLVTAPEDQKIARFIARTLAGRTPTPEERTALTADARQRLALQQTEAHASECTVIHNTGDLHQLESQVTAIWTQLTSNE